MGGASASASSTHIIMKLLVVLAVVGVANCAPLIGVNYIGLDDVARGSVAIHAANSPIVTSYSAASSPLFYNAAPALTRTFYNAAPIVSAPITYRAPAPVVYRAPAPVVVQAASAPKVVTYHAPAPAPVVVQAPPKVVVKTVPAPAPPPVVKTVYVPVDDSAEDDESQNPTVYTAAEQEDSDEDVAVVYSVPHVSVDSDEDKK